MPIVAVTWMRRLGNRWMRQWCDGRWGMRTVMRRWRWTSCTRREYPHAGRLLQGESDVSRLVKGAPGVHKPRRPHRRPVRWAPSPWGNRDPSPGFHRMVLLLRAVRSTNCSLARSGRIGMRCYPVLRHARGNSAPVMSRDSGIRGHPHGLPVRGGSLRTVYRCRGFEAMRTPITSETGQSVCARGLPQVPLPTPAVAL